MKPSLRFQSSLALLSGLAVVLSADPVRAAELELTPFVGYRSGGEVAGDRSADLGASPDFGLSFGWSLRPEAWFEVFWSHQESEFELAPFSEPGERFGLDIDYVHFGGVYRPIREAGHVEPFVTFSAGLTFLQAEPSGFGSDEGLSAAVGGGATIPLGRRVGLRLSARGWFTFTKAQFAGVCVSGACAFELAGEGMTQIDVTAGVVFRLGSSARQTSP